MTDDLIYYGDAVKALGDGKVAGYLVRYGTPKDTDLDGEFFSKETELGVETGSVLPVFYHHGMDGQIKSRKIGKGTLKFDDVGLWFEAQLEMRDEYEKMIYDLAEQGKLGWSSGAAGHLVEFEMIGKSHHIKSWPIAEASLTPTPAEPRNTAISVKSLLKEQEQPDSETPIQEDTMPEEIKAVETEVKEVDYSALIEKAVEEAVKKLKIEEPAVKATVQVVGDEADRALEGNPFKSGTEFFKAVYMAGINRGVDKRLLPLKATGANEAIPSQGGFLVTPEVATTIEQNMWPVGNVLSRFTPMPISSNALEIPAIDETSRADGSRMGGIQAYWLAEAQQATPSKPKFRNIELKLKKLAALVYATDELLQDATAMESWITNNVPNEIRFMIEDSFFNGNGVSKPLGMLNSGCLIQATRADANLIADEDISNMWMHRLLGPQDYVWFANASVMPQLYAMTVGNFPVYQPPRGMADQPFGTLFGRPVIETEYNPYLGTVGDLLLASPSQYIAATRGGMQGASSIHVRFDYFETAFRFVYRIDGQPKLASSITAKDGTNTVSPFVALAATT